MSHPYTNDELKYAFLIIANSAQSALVPIRRELSKGRTWKTRVEYDESELLEFELQETLERYTNLLNMIDDTVRHYFPLTDAELILTRRILNDVEPDQFKYSEESS